MIIGARETMSRRQQRTAKSHPQDLHEVIDVCIGWENLGQVGRFKNGKTWFAASPLEAQGQTYYAWYADRFASRAQAEQRVMNIWAQRIEADAKGSARKEYLERIREAEERADDAEMNRSKEVLDNCSYEELTAALVKHLEPVYSRHNTAREYVTGELFKYIKNHLDSFLTLEHITKLAQEAGLVLTNEQDGVLAPFPAIELAERIGDDWALFKNVDRIRDWLDELGQTVRYEHQGSLLV